jgi:hypothetical protein
VEATFGAVADAYGEPEAHALLAWTWCHFIDSEQAAGLNDWWSLLHPLAVGRAAIPSALGGAGTRALSAALAQWLGDAARARKRHAVTEALAIPLTSDEQALTFVHSGADADPPLVVDPVGLLEVVANQESARRVWIDLMAALTPDQFQPLLTWAEAEGSARGLPPASLDALQRPPPSAGPGGGLPP